ncbi:MAG: hypothetical protein K6E10_12335 [Eubacterium sp.]|nr:hypothetical protein [Eubacterium sp.]
MINVKGCSVTIISDFLMRSFNSEKIQIEDSLKESLTLDMLRSYVTEANSDFVKYDGQVDKGRRAGQIYAIIKKIDKQKKLIGIAVIKRVPGAPSTKKGLERIFEDTTDSYVVTEKYFACGFEKEEEYFDQCLINHFKETIGLGMIKEAEYFDKYIVQEDKKTICVYTIGKVSFFILMTLIWGTAFHNMALGIVYAMLFSTCFTTVTSRVKSKELDMGGC